MHQSLAKWFAGLFTLLSAWSCATCCQSVDVGIGWRRDFLNWNVKDMTAHCVDAVANSHIHFNDIDSYIAYGNARWVDYGYYIRLSADYGWTDKGRARETFQISDSYFSFDETGCGICDVHVSRPIKRRSEVYDFSGAVGYPFTFCCCRLNVVPVIGFSFHRQRLRVKEGHFNSSKFFESNDTSLCSVIVNSPSDLFSSSDITDFSDFTDSNLFSSGSSVLSSESVSEIAPLFGLSFCGHINNYRFTWYGFYAGLDVAYALDCEWTLFAELEYHFLNSCHRKRHSYTGVAFVDSYHKESSCYGFNGTVGTTFCLGNCWYSTLAVDFKWWISHSSSKDHLTWSSVDARVQLGYQF